MSENRNAGHGSIQIGDTIPETRHQVTQEQINR